LESGGRLQTRRSRQLRGLAQQCTVQCGAPPPPTRPFRRPLAHQAWFKLT
jgi:hypothetical protein